MQPLQTFSVVFRESKNTTNRYTSENYDHWVEYLAGDGDGDALICHRTSADAPWCVYCGDFGHHQSCKQQTISLAELFAQHPKFANHDHRGEMVVGTNGYLALPWTTLHLDGSVSCNYCTLSPERRVKMHWWLQDLFK